MELTGAQLTCTALSLYPGWWKCNISNWKPGTSSSTCQSHCHLCEFLRVLWKTGICLICWMLSFFVAWIWGIQDRKVSVRSWSQMVPLWLAGIWSFDNQMASHEKKKKNNTASRLFFYLREIIKRNSYSPVLCLSRSMYLCYVSCVCPHGQSQDGELGSRAAGIGCFSAWQVMKFHFRIALIQKQAHLPHWTLLILFSIIS